MMLNSSNGVGTNTNFTLDLSGYIEPKNIELLYANIPTDTNNTSGGVYYVCIPEFGISVKNSSAISFSTFVVPNTATLGQRAIYNTALNFKQNSEINTGSSISRLSVIIKNADGSVATDMGSVQLIVKLNY